MEILVTYSNKIEGDTCKSEIEFATDLDVHARIKEAIDRIVEECAYGESEIDVEVFY